MIFLVLVMMVVFKFILDILFIISGHSENYLILLFQQAVTVLVYHAGLDLILWVVWFQWKFVFRNSVIFVVCFIYLVPLGLPVFPASIDWQGQKRSHKVRLQCVLSRGSEGCVEIALLMPLNAPVSELGVKNILPMKIKKFPKSDHLRFLFSGPLPALVSLSRGRESGSFWQRC